MVQSEVSRELITLRNGHCSVQVHPGAGGAITRYWYDDGAGLVRDWLWPARSEAIANREARGMSCFPLVPYSNRIRNGRFRFGGRTIVLPLNFLPQRHSIHGHGWQNPWQVLDASSVQLVIEYRHQPDEWPWSYLARQTFHLSQMGLRVSIEAHNQSPEPMPVGIGLHPYLPRTALAKVTAQSDKIWLNDKEVMPVRLAAPGSNKDLSRGLRVDQVELDNAFTGWNGQALIEWPEWNARLRITASAPLRFVVVFTPPGEPYFCVEPVSNITDAFNQAGRGEADSGMQILPADQSISGTVDFIPGFLT